MIQLPFFGEQITVSATHVDAVEVLYLTENGTQAHFFHAIYYCVKVVVINDVVEQQV